VVIRDELSRLWGWGEHHRRLAARLTIALTLTLAFDLVCTVLVWRFERHADGTEIHTFGDALFFSTVAIVVVAWMAGSFGAFFRGGDKVTAS